jgi:outer membrane lipoprotein carrier protein
MNRAAVTAVLALCLLAGLVRAAGEGATAELLARLQRISQLQGEFVQRQYGDGETVIAQSSGVFRLLRPVYFSWEIRSPDRQLVVANAEHLWHYDMDLQTATRRPVVGNIESSPLQVLGGDESVLREQYEVERTGADSFTLVPIDARQGFRRLAVTFDGDVIRQMDIVDKLGQRVVVDFSNVDNTTPLTGADFEFTPPEGEVDMFYYDE